jgi:hypothetical protein
MTTTRREFSIMSGTALGATALGLRAKGAVETAARQPSDESTIWHRRFKRLVQINFNERDAESLPIEAYAEFLRATRAQVTFISVTGIVAFYPSSIPDFPRSAFYKNRDIFGECVAAAKINGTRIIGRMSPDLVDATLVEKYPQWFCRSKDGNVIRDAFGAIASGEGNDAPPYGRSFASTCQFSSYYDERIPQIIKELISRYDIDGIYTNAWPGVDAQVCYCEACQKIGDPTTETYKIAYQKRAEELWSLYQTLVSADRGDRIFSGNLGGRFKGGSMDLSRLLATAPIFVADNQGRLGPGEAAWDVSQQCRLAVALMKGRTAVNITGAYHFSWDLSLFWRNVSGDELEVRQRLAQGLAAGVGLYYHWLGADQGFREDRRWQAVAMDFFPWQAAHDKHFHNIRSIANVGLVVSQRSIRLYKAPPGVAGEASLQGMYELLTESRIPFDVVLDRDLTAEHLSRYSVLILPNVALLGDHHVAAIERFVGDGGSLLTTFETGLFDENGVARSDFGLGDIYAMRKIGERVGYRFAHIAGGAGPAGLQRLEQAARTHPVTSGFKDTNWIAGSSYRVPISASGPLYLTNIAPYRAYPPEAVFSPEPHTQDSVAVFRETGRSRLAYFAYDLEATYQRSGAADPAALLSNAMRWLLRGDLPLSVHGAGLVETFGWQTEPGYAIHLINFNYPNFKAGSRRNIVSVGDQKVRLVLNDSKSIKSARLLRADKHLPIQQKGNVVEFTVPNLADYEVAALEA